MKTQFIVIGEYVLEAPSDPTMLPNNKRFDSFDEAVQSAREHLLERIQKHLSKMNLLELHEAERELARIVIKIDKYEN